MARLALRSLFFAIAAEVLLLDSTLTSLMQSYVADCQQTTTAGWTDSPSFDTLETHHINSTLLEIGDNHSAPERSQERNPQGSTWDSRENASSAQSQSNAILFVHVGKAGGMTLRNATYISCLGNAPVRNPRSPSSIEKCVRNKLPPDAVLPHRVKYVVHMFGFDSSQIKDSAAYLFVLRHPVDRYISAFHFMHVDNRLMPTKDAKRAQLAHDFYHVCFPTIEDLAQLGVAPWHNTIGVKYGDRMISECYPKARAAAAGRVGAFAPHFLYNYKYYASLTTEAHPDKQIYVVRTEYEWNDMVELDIQLGGSGNFHNLGNNHTHGSERYKNNTYISMEGYQKLCCILVHEIELYESILFQASNLNEMEKQRTIQQVYGSCGITPTWSEWKTRCLHQLDIDRRSLEIRV